MGFFRSNSELVIGLKESIKRKIEKVQVSAPAFSRTTTPERLVITYIVVFTIKNVTYLPKKNGRRGKVTNTGPL